MDKLPKRWRVYKFVDVCSRITDGSHFSPKTIENGFPYVTVKDVSDSGEIDIKNCKKISENAFKDLAKSNCQPNIGDVLLSKDGTVGKTALVNNNEKFVVLSSLAILSPLPTVVHSKFFYLFLNSPDFQEKAISSKTGAAIKRIVLKNIKEFEIPVPPLAEQIRIIAKLDALFARIDKSIKLLEENIKHTNGLMASVLEEVFVNGKSWKREPLNKVAKVERGKSKHRPRNDEKLFGKIYPFIQTGDVRKANKYIERYEVCYSEFGLNQSRLWNKGTICLTIAANIGDVAILGLDACFPDSVVGITPNSMNNEFLYYYLKTLQLQLDKKANAAAQKNINLKILNEIDVPVPSFETQKSIADRFSRLEEKQFKILSTQQSKLTYLKALKSSILDRAFKGEL